MYTLTELSGQFFSNELRLDSNDVGCLKRTLEKFCKSGKKEDAFSVYFCFCEMFNILGSGYDTMGKLLEFLSDHEYHSGELLVKHRDHYSHSVYVFALGLAIYANDAQYKQQIRTFYDSDGFDDQEFLKLWGLTSLFHDVGYPFQLSHEQIKSYVEEMWGEKNATNPYVTFENMEGLLQFAGKSDGNYPYALKTLEDLMVYGINLRLGYPKEIVEKSVKKRYEHQTEYMDHGYFSAILLANKLLEAKTNFDVKIIDVLTAISLHNSLNKYDIKKALGHSTAIALSQHPLAYLLILCDELQNWDRTAFGYVSKKDPLAWDFNLDVSGTGITALYTFDSFDVVETKIQKTSDGKSIIFESRRPNINVKKIKSKEFVDELRSLLLCHTSIEIVADEKKKTKKLKTFASSDKFVNLCDFAKAIHASYQSVYGGPDFEDLSLEFKLSNIEQAKSYSDKLELINCFYSDKELDYPVIKEFSSRRTEDKKSEVRDDLGFLAREEHIRWVKEKLAAGWKYGTDYQTNAERNFKKIHKDIVPYDCLPQEEKEKDELMIRNMIPFLNNYGHGIRIYSYRTGRKPVLDIAGCGHRTISMKDEKTKCAVKEILAEYQKDYRVVVRTNFAFGADQLIAQCANELGITIKAAIPFEFEEYIQRIKEDAQKYHYIFTEEDEMNMRHLLAQVPSLKVIPDPQFGYLEASKYIINKSKKMIALWDGVETILEDEKGNPINQGGTWHNICIARQSRGLTDEDIHIVKCRRG